MAEKKSTKKINVTEEKDNQSLYDVLNNIVDGVNTHEKKIDALRELIGMLSQMINNLDMMITLIILNGDKTIDEVLNLPGNTSFESRVKTIREKIVKVKPDFTERIAKTFKEEKKDVVSANADRPSTK